MGLKMNPTSKANDIEFVHDGLTLYRMDQIYDDDAGGLSDTDEWRVWWENGE